MVPTSKPQCRRNAALERLGLSRGAEDTSTLLTALGAGGSLPQSLLSPVQQLSALNSSLLSQDTTSLNPDVLLNALVGQDALRRKAQLLAFQHPLTACNPLDSYAASASQVSLTNAVNQDSMFNNAFQRGKEEVILSLLRSGAVDPSLLKNKLISQAPSVSLPALNGMSRVATSTSTSVDRGALEALGTSGIERRRKNTPYFDASSLADPDPVALANRRTRGGVTEPFPEKLHRLLQECEVKGESDVISFFPHGRAFCIHHVERFCREIMPRYFKQSRLSSFQRQLNLYGFTRITSGPDTGGYYHELFLKGRPALVIHMRRVGVPKSFASHRPSAPRPSNSATPNFYSMSPVKGSKKDNVE